jgi:pimeloyl-ACP methyl ester carboxylesterase
MTNPGIYGEAPFSVVLIHGGPGCPGSMTPVSREISKYCGVIEPFQTSKSIEGQIRELSDVIKKYADAPVILIGHSWGAWLSFIFSAKRPSMVKKLILISCAPFEEKYVSGISDLRMARITLQEKVEVEKLVKLLNNQGIENNKAIFKRFGEIMSKADSYEAIISDNDETEYQPDVFFSIWNEAVNLRQTGELLQFGHKIKCHVTVIHGDYDPHPSDGVKVPLSGILKDCKFILLEKCGHTPWLEKYALEKFYEILKKEIGLKS